MRQKYRIWDKQNGCWYEPTYEAYKGKLEDLALDPSGDLVMHTLEGGEVQLIHESVFPNRFETVWFTGLKDKNGKEISEGDIVHCISQWDAANMVVIFEEGEFRMVLCDNYKGYVTGCGFYAIRTFSKEVIGNIYEHPHLLKGDEADAQTT